MESSFNIPASGFLIPDFREQAAQVALTQGMPGIRIQFLRGTVWGLSPELIRSRIVDGVNAVSGQPMMREMITKLTAPLSAEERDMSPRKMDIGPETYTDTEDNLHRLFEEKRYTDYLPIVLPTKERVDAMLAQTSHSPDTHLGTMDPGSVAGERWSYTVRHAAIAAVMAGAKPEYFPVILALGSTGTSAVNISDNGFTGGAVINGRIRDEIGLNYDIGAIGPYAHANQAIGRAWGLLSINGGNCGKVGTTYMGTVGNPTNLTSIIIAENEEESPWEPLSVRTGLRPGENAVTLISGWGILSARNWAITDWTATPNYSENIRNIYRLQNPSLFGTFVVLSPPIADFVVNEGNDTLEKLHAFVTTPDPNAKPKGPGGGAPGGGAPGGAAKPKEGAAAKPGGGAPGAGAPGGAAKPKEGVAAKPGGGAPPKPKAAPAATGGGFGVVVTGARNNNYWMIGGMQVGRTVAIDPWR